ncbi:Hypothetical protein I595_347 [Croceitalea dokdonensis DOKDO 023]|uniref:Uncharacterized protein n=1 Tax=Croceitalea dokdonensis DOKDO 023 TaxID=1300341 RepID=A0A0N8H4I2_9FLAO|nr:Hypothetical protein I595_347 [Croceitalea dokdonensis DOKDO 023]
MDNQIGSQTYLMVFLQLSLLLTIVILNEYLLIINSYYLTN